MSTEHIEYARKKFRQFYGDAFASKATDDFCKFYSDHSLITKGSKGLSFDGTVTGMSPKGNLNAIIEFKKEQENYVGSPILKEAYQKALASLNNFPDLARSLEIDLKRLQNRANIKRVKENSIRNAQLINSYLEKQIEKAFVKENRSITQEAFFSRYCWLNRSVKTIAGNDTIAEVIQDHGIERLDIPRKIKAEINITGHLMEIIEYRTRFNRNGENIRIGVIDGEIDIHHPALKNRVVQAKNYTKEAWGNAGKHGTAIAGIIASDDNGFLGMAPKALLYNYKVLATHPALSSDNFEGGCAIERAVEDGMQIVNCSWGSGFVTEELSIEAKACNEAWKLGLVVVKSSGNEGPNLNTLTRPAEAEGVIVVGATGKDGISVEGYSSRGKLVSGEIRPHIVAPGGTAANGINSCLLNGGFGDVGDGTSLAAPHITGMVALLLEEHPHFSPDQIRDTLIKLCNFLNTSNVESQGAGFCSMSSLML